MSILTRLAVKLGIYKEIVTVVEKPIVIKPLSDLKIGDRVIVQYLNNTKRGTVINPPHFQTTLPGLCGGGEYVPIEFDDGDLHSPPTYLVHKCEQKQ